VSAPDGASPNFDAYGTWADDRIRVAKTVEGLEQITRLWTSREPFDFVGKYHSLKGAVLEPKPVRSPHPQLWFSGMGEYTVKKVLKKYGDTWLPPVPGLTEEEYERILSMINEGQGSAKGRRINVIFNGTLREISSSIEKYSEMGCEGAMLVRTPYEELASTMRKFVEVARSYEQ
jgi:alkanesulfonate monooxygenase SsuD/methylene tetrahydromethanopterin reductase-like flavin-dependent oxidoreductase (luciferase family)